MALFLIFFTMLRSLKVKLIIFLNKAKHTNLFLTLHLESLGITGYRLETKHRLVRCLNNLISQDTSQINGETNFSTSRTASTTIKGMENNRRIYKKEPKKWNTLRFFGIY